MLISVSNNDFEELVLIVENYLYIFHIVVVIKIKISGKIV